MARKKLLTESEVKGMICTCQVCGNKFIDTTGMNGLMCPRCIEETVAKHKNRMAEKCVTSPNSILGNKPADATEPKVELSDEYMHKHLKEALYTDTQQKIIDVLGGMESLLLYKNQKYGDSALKPKNIFYKGDATNSILIRLDDKIGRVTSNPDDKPRVNDVADIIGYCVLLLISMGVTREDLAKFMD